MSTKVTDDKDSKTVKPLTDAAPAAQALSQQRPMDVLSPQDSTALQAHHPVPSPNSPLYHPLTITLTGLTANSKAFVTIRDDQEAIWSDGVGKGLVGLSIEATKDPMLFVSSFLVNARELYLQTNANSQEIQIQLYVLTPQSDLRGRVDLPPNASVTLTSRTDRTSLIGLSSFVVEL